LKWVFILSLPCSLALLLFSTPVVSVLYHYGAFKPEDVEQTRLALMGYAFGLMGLVAIKVLAPGFYASQDTKTPVRIAIGVLILTQLMNLVWVPLFAHAGLALSIGIGALFNAALLWYFLKRSGRYTPQPGWGTLFMQGAVASSLMGAFLFWANAHWNWTELGEHLVLRIVLLSLILLIGAVVYLGTLWALGLRLRSLLTPQQLTP
jgi:putative peptidoglycan lipid II flippase